MLRAGDPADEDDQNAAQPERQPVDELDDGRSPVARGIRVHVGAVESWLAQRHVLRELPVEEDLPFVESEELAGQPVLGHRGGQLGDQAAGLDRALELEVQSCDLADEALPFAEDLRPQCR